MTTKDVKFWLEDKELKTPEHDDMVLWSFNNIEKVLTKLNLIQDMLPDCYRADISHWDWNKKEFIIDDNYYIQEIKKLAKELKSDELKEAQEEYKQIQKKKLEVTEDFKKFLDLLKQRKEQFLFEKKIEFSLYRGNWNIGFIDLKIGVKFNLIKTRYFSEHFQKEQYRPSQKFFYLEIKPKIISVGETMRQINFYRDYISRDENSSFVLITKTKELTDIFNSQDVFVYEYKEEKEGEKQRTI